MPCNSDAPPFDAFERPKAPDLPDDDASADCRQPRMSRWLRRWARRAALLVALVAHRARDGNCARPCRFRHDYAVEGGRLFTQAANSDIPDAGFAVTDADGLPFWTEFQRLGGVQALGYPISRRFVWDGFTVQVFQKVVLQWQPEFSGFAFVNVFDRLTLEGYDDHPGGTLGPAIGELR